MGCGICSPDQTRTTVCKPPFTDPRVKGQCKIGVLEVHKNHRTKTHCKNQVLLELRDLKKISAKLLRVRV